MLSRRPIPTVRGPGGELYLIDHHHLGLALWQAQFEHAFALVIADYSKLEPVAFWSQMEAAGRLYPFDEEGERVAPMRLPTWLHAMRHDPYRDMATVVREAGGFLKTSQPYAEFHWARYFRQRISLTALRRDRTAAFGKAMKLCRHPEAAELPGYVQVR